MFCATKLCSCISFVKLIPGAMAVQGVDTDEGDRDTQAKTLAEYVHKLLIN